MTIEDKDRPIIQKVAMAVVPIVLAAMLGQGIMIYSSIQVLGERVKVTNDKIQAMESNLDRLNRATVDRWTRQNHQSYADKMEAKYERILARIRDLEKRDK
ncbi:MAG: hypothetical protein P1V97_23495 [Planctomycetota bacterium]|nr:hypothetical protein [Planctomycetota bacterium]